jgi:peptide/nickel transport system permease protein
MHWLGTDYLERDIFSRIIWGARTTIGISVVATLLAYLFGVTLGIAAAVSGGWTDMGLSRVNDAILSLPTIMLGLLIVVALGASIPVLIGTAAVIYASSVFRIARALGQDIMVMDFVEAARARGEGLWWVITREVLPNAAMPLATDFGLRLVFVVLFISSMSFLGVGIQPPAADWGSMVRQNLEGLGYGSYAAVWPALAIATFTIAVNLIVDDISAEEGGSLAKKMI